jgi:hypothetical protein
MSLIFNFGQRGEKFTAFNINLGTNDCPRFSCACHKNNVAVRMAIKKSKPLCQVLRVLSAYAAKTKNSINLYKLNLKTKAKLRIENQTRWSSSFLMLAAFQQFSRR